MKPMHISTYITADSIITKLRKHNDEYTLFTTRSGTSMFKTIIKFTKYRKVLWTLEADSTTDAVIKHIALFNMANDHSILHWSTKLLDEDKVKQLAETIKIKAKDNTLYSAFTSKLLKAAGMDATRIGMATNFDKLTELIAALAAVILIIGYWVLY